MRLRRAFTMIEVLLVLALLVIMAALAWPSLTRPFAVQRLRSAADAVRTEWAAARLESIKSGRAYVFRYMPGAGEFSIETQVLPEAMVGDGAVEDPENPGMPVDEFKLAPKTFRLPDGVVFSGGEAGYDSRAETMADAGISGAAPILFFPDGTATDAVVTLENQQGGGMIEISLRGVTGVANVGRVFSGGGP